MADILSDEDWPRRLQQLRDALAPLSAQVPALVKDRGPNTEAAQQAYGALDRLSERAAILLDEMDGADAPIENIETCEDLLDAIEVMRDGLSGKLAKPKRRPGATF